MFTPARISMLMFVCLCMHLYLDICVIVCMQMYLFVYAHAQNVRIPSCKGGYDYGTGKKMALEKWQSEKLQIMARRIWFLVCALVRTYA